MAASVNCTAQPLVPSQNFYFHITIDPNFVFLLAINNPSCFDLNIFGFPAASQMLVQAKRGTFSSKK